MALAVRRRGTWYICLAVAAIVPLLAAADGGCEAKNTKTGPSFGSKHKGKHAKGPRSISIKLETRGTAFRQEIRYWVHEGNMDSEDPPTFKAPFNGKHFVRYITLKPGERVLFHAENKQHEGTHVRCTIWYQKKKMSDYADPVIAACSFRAPG